MNQQTDPTPSAFDVPEKPTYNPPATVRRQNYVPSWLDRFMGMFRRTVRPERQRNFELFAPSTQRAEKPGHKSKAVMKRRRLRDIAGESRKKNRAK